MSTLIETEIVPYPDDAKADAWVLEPGFNNHSEFGFSFGWNSDALTSGGFRKPDGYQGRDTDFLELSVQACDLKAGEERSEVVSSHLSEFPV